MTCKTVTPFLVLGTISSLIALAEFAGSFLIGDHERVWVASSFAVLAAAVIPTFSAHYIIQSLHITAQKKWALQWIGAALFLIWFFRKW